MAHWLQDRLKIISLTFRHPALLVGFGTLQAFRLLLEWGPLSQMGVPFLNAFKEWPWYGWVIGWVTVLWFTSIEYAVQRKELFDKTSLNFFKAFLDFLIHHGNSLFKDSEEKNFYSKLNDWQHQVIEGIAIGLGHEESEKYYQKMDHQNPLPKAYRLSQDSNSSEPLCQWLQENLEELNQIRMNLTETKEFKEEDLERVKNIKLLGDSSR